MVAAVERKTSFRVRIRRFLRSLLRVVAASTLGAALLGVGLGVWMYREFESDLPTSLSVLTDYRPLRASQVLSADGEVIAEFFVEKRTLLPIEKVPPLVRQAFVAAEDVRFYKHGGVDYWGILRAAWANARAGHVVQGGSTITQQTAKLLILGQERSLARKIREAMLAHRIEKRLSKDQILGIYLNHVYLGHGAYGIAAAAAAYFGKEVEDLSAAEAAMLGAMPKAPGRSTPFRDYKRAKARQHYVIEQMQALGFLTATSADQARQEALVLVSRGRQLRNVAAPYFVEAIRQYVALNHGDEDLLERGLRIHTTLDMRRQRAAEGALRRGLEDLERRLGFSGPIGHLSVEERGRMQKGPPRPFGPAGFSTQEDPEQSGLLVVPELRAVELDATQPGAVLPERAGQLAANETAIATRKAAKAAPPPPEFDPATIYAAMVSGMGRRLTLSSGTLETTLDPEDEARALAWRAPDGSGLKVGDVLPVFFSYEQVSPPKKQAAPVLRARLSASPSVQAALVAIDPRNGHLLAMVGGYDYQVSQFNRARQARRQVGSAIKPFIYAAAMESGLTPLTIRYDVPVKFRTAGGVWAPKNYRPNYLGAVTLRTALAKSINTVAAQLTAQLGVTRLIELLRRAGVTSKLPHALSLSLGTADLSLEELAYALASFPAGGRRVPHVSVLRVTDAEGNVLEDNRAPPEPKDIDQVASPEAAFLITDMMRAVAEEGTARKAKALGRPVAGKTGTSNGYRDAWFLGFSPELLCGVWVGRDDFTPIGHDMTGGHAALPIWLDFMTDALKDQPVSEFEVPPGVMFVRADPEKGVPATPANPKSRLVPVQRGALPPAFRSAAHIGSFGDPQF